MDTIRIVNPTFGRRAGAGNLAAARAIDWKNDSIILFGNSKPNSEELLRGLSERLSSKLGRQSPVDYIQKNNAAVGAAPEVLTQVAAKYKSAIVALGD